MSEQTKKCPYCSEEILATAIKCKHCHSMLNGNSNFNEKTPITSTGLAFTSQYEIIEKIGTGGMANVYKAKQKSLGRLVALKVFHQGLTQDSELYERFQREARICATLKHQNIVNVYDVGYENGYHFISMEYVPGINLHQLINQKGKLNSDQTLKIVLSLAEALDYAHSKGIIHRDIKSSNILISEEGKIYLTDFGIAHAAHESKITLPQEALGTPEYMSPEQIEMEELDGRTDYYSLGVVMYECLTGHVPFSSGNPLLVLDKIRTGDTPDISKEIPGLNENIILANLGLLDKRKKNRLSSLKQLQEMLCLKTSDRFNSNSKEDSSVVKQLFRFREIFDNNRSFYDDLFGPENKQDKIISETEYDSSNLKKSFDKVENLLAEFYKNLSGKTFLTTDFDNEIKILSKIEDIHCRFNNKEIHLAYFRARDLLNILSQAYKYLPYSGFHIRFLFETSQIFKAFTFHEEKDNSLIFIKDGEFLNINLMVDEGSHTLVSKGDQIIFGCPVHICLHTLSPNHYLKKRGIDSWKDSDRTIKWTNFTNSIKKIFVI